MVLTLHKPATDKAVHWDEAVIDNEHMGKKTSKCKSTVLPAGLEGQSTFVQYFEILSNTSTS